MMDPTWAPVRCAQSGPTVVLGSLNGFSITHREPYGNPQVGGGGVNGFQLKSLFWIATQLHGMNSRSKGTNLLWALDGSAYMNTRNTHNWPAHKKHI